MPAERPGAFLAIAAGAGVLAGRLTKGLTADSGGSGTGVERGSAWHHRATAARSTLAETAGSYETQSAADFAAPGAQPKTTFTRSANRPSAVAARDPRAQPRIKRGGTR